MRVYLPTLDGMEFWLDLFAHSDTFVLIDER